MALVFHKLVSVNEALLLLEQRLGGIGPLDVAEVSILDAAGMVLAEDVRAPIDYPPFDRSTVDGYAVRSLDVAGASEATPIKLKVTGSSTIGIQPAGEVGPGDAYQIATGAMIPKGADSVVMEEYVVRKGNELTVYRATVPGENISQSGSDISAGDVVLRAGTLITAREVAVLAGLGINKVKVFRRPKAVVFSTGSELVTPGVAPLPPGKLYDIDGYVITALLKELGADVEFRGILPDDYQKMREAIEKAVNEADIVITTGSTSAGYGDMIYKVFKDIGAEMLVHGLKTRPGKPTAIAVKGRKILFGLPGFPLSAMMVFHSIVTPVVLKMRGLEPQRSATTVRARVPFRMNAGKGFMELIPVMLVQGSGGLSAYPIMSGSGSIVGIGLADGYIVAEENREFFDENEEVEVTLFSSELKVPELTIIGSNCPGIEVILKVSGQARSSRIISVGSMGGWLAIKRGDADLAGTHLLDDKTLQYNVHVPEIMGLKGEVTIYRGYARRIGLLVRKGNPKNIRGFEDLLRPDVTIVNRNKGSGTRVLLDLKLKELLKGERPEKVVKGYTYEVKTHTAVATAILQGRADTGLSLEAVARMFGLDFIPVGEEIYDFVVRKEREGKSAVRRFLEALASKEFAEVLPRELPGYRVLPDTGRPVYK